MQYPNMILEVLEAIGEYFKNDDDISADCYLYLSSILPKEDKDYAKNCLNQMGRCEKCGCELVAHEWDERHSELDDSPKEHFCEYLCPECDKIPAN